MFDSEDNIFSLLGSSSVKIDSHLNLLLNQYGYNVNEKLLQSINQLIFVNKEKFLGFLIFACCDIFKIKEELAINLAVSVELNYICSLIYENLLINNDNLNSKLELFNSEFGKEILFLAAGSLQNLSFEILCRLTNIEMTVKIDLIKYLVQSAGINGMIGGKIIEFYSKDVSISVNEITRMHRMKIGELFSYSCEVSSIIARSTKKVRSALRGYALSISLAFQMINDINKKKIDRNISINNYTLIMDENDIYNHAKLLIERAKNHLFIIGDKADLLKKFADYIVSK